KELRFFSLNELPSNLPPVIERIIKEFQHSN
ncbi:DNA mismatch repair protein MutT, partial [Bacillus cereus]